MTFVLLVWFCRQLLHYLASFEQHSTGCCPWPVRNSTGIVLCMQHLGAISNVSVLLVSSTELPVSKQEHTKYTRNVMSVNSPWWVFSFFFFLTLLSFSFLPKAALTLYLPWDSCSLLPFFFLQFLPTVSSLNAIGSMLWLFLWLSSSTLFQLLRSLIFLCFLFVKEKEKKVSLNPSLGGIEFDFILSEEGEDCGSSLCAYVGHGNK